MFDLQTGVAETFGYTNTRGLRASEVLMRRYYWAAKAVTQLNQILILNIEERVHGSQNAPMRVINDRFLDQGRLAGGRQRRPLSARPSRDSRYLPDLPARQHPQRPLSPHPARPVQRVA